MGLVVEPALLVPREQLDADLDALDLSVRTCAPAWGLDAWGRHDMELLLPYARRP